MNFLASIIAAVLVGILKSLLENAQARGDLTRATTLEVELGNARRIQDALLYKVAAADDPASGDLRVRDGAQAVPLPGAASRPPDDPH